MGEHRELTTYVHVDGFAAPPNILKPEAIRTMTTASARNAGYAKGWEVNRANNWWHNGSLPGTATVAVRTHSGLPGVRTRLSKATSTSSFGTWSAK
jgi:hypothetical protein